jgi:hypothetical protein
MVFRQMSVETIFQAVLSLQQFQIVKITQAGERAA